MRTIVKMNFGSRLYGTATETSDRDYKSVFLPSAAQIVLQHPVARGTVSHSTKADRTSKNLAGDVDDEAFSLMKFMKMLEVGDMIASEMLFAPEKDLLHVTPEWEELIRNRERFLNRRIRGFLGYCTKQAAKYGIKGSRVACARAALEAVCLWIDIAGPLAKLGQFEEKIEAFINTHPDYSRVVPIDQPSGRKLLHWSVNDRLLPYSVSLRNVKPIIQKMMDTYGHRAILAEKNEGVDWKAMSHAVRVGQQAIELVRHHNITFPRPNASELLRIKAGEVPYAEVAAMLESLLDEIDDAAAHSALPEEPDLKWMEKTVYDHYADVVIFSDGGKGDTV